MIRNIIEILKIVLTVFVVPLGSFFFFVGEIIHYYDSNHIEYIPWLLVFSAQLLASIVSFVTYFYMWPVYIKKPASNGYKQRTQHHKAINVTLLSVLLNGGAK